MHFCGRSFIASTSTCSFILIQERLEYFIDDSVSYAKVFDDLATEWCIGILISEPFQSMVPMHSYQCWADDNRVNCHRLYCNILIMVLNLSYCHHYCTSLTSFRSFSGFCSLISILINRSLHIFLTSRVFCVSTSHFHHSVLSHFRLLRSLFDFLLSPFDIHISSFQFFMFLDMSPCWPDSNAKGCWR